MQNRRIYGKIGSESPEIPGQNKETDTVISSEKSTVLAYCIQNERKIAL